LYLFNDITTKDISAPNKYDDIRRGPHLNLEVQEDLYNGLYTCQNVTSFGQDFVTTCGKSVSLFFYLESLNAELHIL